MTAVRVSEQAVAEVVVAYLEALGADVYQEVEVPGGVADIVARVHAELWIVEVKSSLSLALLYQAMDRRELAHRVIVAAPFTRQRDGFGALCNELGIGLWRVEVGDHAWSMPPRVTERVASRRWNTRPVALAAKLQPEHKTHAKAGSVGAGGRWTPFRATCEELARIAAAKPGITLKAAITEIKHHYRTPSSARSSLAHWLEKGKVPGVRLDCGDVPRLYPLQRKDGP